MKVAALVPLCPGAARPSVLDRKIAGGSALDHVVARLARVNGLGAVVIATSSRPCDDRVEQFCRTHEIFCFRSAIDECDELGLVLAALKNVGAEACLLARAESPFVDPAILQRVVDLVLMTDGMVDFVGTTLARRYPAGMNVEGFTTAALEDAGHRCANFDIRRDAAAYLRQNSRLYRLLAVEPEPDMARPELGFDLQSDADLETLGEIAGFFGGRTDISLAELIAFVDTRI
jgi:spore coat polysaccharide biosynthesis protein SpsF